MSVRRLQGSKGIVQGNAPSFDPNAARAKAAREANTITQSTNAVQAITQKDDAQDKAQDDILETVKALRAQLQGGQGAQAREAVVQAFSPEDREWLLTTLIDADGLAQQAGMPALSSGTTDAAPSNATEFSPELAAAAAQELLSQLDAQAGRAASITDTGVAASLGLRPSLDVVADDVAAAISNAEPPYVDNVPAAFGKPDSVAVSYAGGEKDVAVNAAPGIASGEVGELASAPRDSMLGFIHEFRMLNRIDGLPSLEEASLYAFAQQFAAEESEAA